MTLQEIKHAVLAGKTVCWINEGTEVHHNNDQWLIVTLVNSYAIGLTWLDGVTMNGEEKEFFIK